MYIFTKGKKYCKINTIIDKRSTDFENYSDWNNYEGSEEIYNITKETKTCYVTYN